MPLVTKPYTVALPAETIEADVRCQQCAQSSTTLANACLLIRRGETDLAAHVLDTLDKAKTASFRDVVTYLRAWLRIEDKDFSRAKADLLARVHQQPGDVTALSLLQACMAMELESGAQPGKPKPEPPVAEAEIAAAPAPQTKAGPEPEPSPVPDSSESVAAEDAPIPAPAPENSISDAEFAPYSAVRSDPHTRAFALWNSKGDARVESRKEGMEGVLDILHEFPSPFVDSVARLEGGEIQKIGFSFQEITVSTWHDRETAAGLITGPFQPSMAVIVRTDKIFQKRASPAPARVS